jgi:predicted ATPase
VLALPLQLVDKSLAVPEEDASGSQRYRLLDSLRHNGRERLLERSEFDPVRDRHARYFLAFTERAEPELNGPQQAEWIKRLAVDESNLLAALDWLASREQVQDTSG